MTAKPHRFIKRQKKTPWGNRWLVRCQPCRESMDDYDDRFGARVWIQRHVGGISGGESDRIFLGAARWPEVGK